MNEKVNEKVNEKSPVDKELYKDSNESFWLLVEILPYLEMLEDAPEYKAGEIKALLRKVGDRMTQSEAVLRKARGEA